MNKLQAFQVTMATKLHMTGSYDMQRHGIARSRFNAKALQSRNDQWVFNKLAEDWLYQRRLMSYVAAVYVVFPSIWVGELTNREQYKPHYKRLQRYINAPVNYVKEDTQFLIDRHGSVGNALAIEDNQIPPIVNDAIGGYIHPETVVMYNRMTRLFDRINSAVNDDNPIWKSIGHRLTKYEPFVTIQSRDVITKCKDAVRNLTNDT